MDKKHISISDFIKNLNQKMGDLNIHIFHFNPLQVNTIVLHDSTNEAVIVDPGNCQSYEDAQLKEYVERNNLTVKAIINTHPHVDHIMGNKWCRETFGAPICCHEAGMPIYRKALAYATLFGGIEMEEPPQPERFLHENDEVRFGDHSLRVLYTPGHCEGSISLLDERNHFLICGDLIFEGSVGRSDLPTGNGSLMLNMIKTKVLTLDDDTTIYPGHGGLTTVGQEKKYNPFLV